MAYPDELTNYVDGPPGTGTEILAGPLNGVEAHLGIPGSAVVSSLDYLLKNPASEDPGHMHTGGGLSGGADGDVFYKAAGVWGPGTPEAAGLLAKTGDQSISGVKTFASIPIGPASDPTTDNQLARKIYVDSQRDTRIAHNLATAASDFLVASGAGAFVKKTLAETKTLLGFTDTSSQDPGHKHSKLWASDGSPEAVTVNAAGLVGVGTATPYADLGNAVTVNGVTYSNFSLQIAGTTIGYVCAVSGGFLNAAIGDRYCNFSTNEVERLHISSAGNIGFATNVFGTALAKGLGMGSGTEPSSAPADMAQIWVGDINGAAGYAGFHKRTEGTNQKEVIPGVIIKADTGSPANPYEGLMEINTFDNKVRMYADAGWRELGTW